MELRLRYGRIHAENASDAPLWPVPRRPARLIDDMLGLLRFGLPETAVDRPYQVHLWATYQWTSVLRFPSEELLARGLLFGSAVDVATTGRLAVEQLSPYLDRVRHLAPGLADIPTRRALGGGVEIEIETVAAWALQELLRQRPLQPRDCDTCSLPWLGERAATSCSRPALGQATACRHLSAQRRFVDRYTDFFLERGKLYGRLRRGTLSEESYAAWLKANRPGLKGETWVPYEQWKESDA